MELGVKEELAHKLADDANMDTIKKMSANDVATKLGLKMGDNELETIMDIIREQSASKRRRPTRRVEMKAELRKLETSIPLGEMRFNVLNHELVPLHELVSEDEEMEELSPWELIGSDVDGNQRLRRELLPKILITDPAIQALKEALELENDELRAGWLNNRVVRITRRSPSAGIHVAYRLVVEGN
tara:strand:+ start:534 stop:1091 length:558 start_codon:yes stop_codon:yes gene_type:complete